MPAIKCQDVFLVTVNLCSRPISRLFHPLATKLMKEITLSEPQATFATSVKERGSCTSKNFKLNL